MGGAFPKKRRVVDGGRWRQAVGRRVGGWDLHAWTRTKFFATFSSSIASTVVFRVSDNTEGGMTTSHTTLVVTVVEGGGHRGEVAVNTTREK